MIELRPIKESTTDWDRLEALIKLVFRRLLYKPLLDALELPKDTVTNAKELKYEALHVSLQKGSVVFDRGVFSGRFSAAVSRELRALGAKWDRKTSTFRLPQNDLPIELRGSIAASEHRFQERLKRIDRALSQNLPAEIAENLNVSSIFSTVLWKTDRELSNTLRGITVAPELSEKARSRVATEWQENMRLWIKDFTAEEIERLRGDVKKSVLSGNRYQSLIKSIQRSYGVTQKKAKFLARQETSLMLSKHKEVRYTDAGIHEYRWQCVVGSPKHPVRPAHKKLEGTIQRWDTPPITTEPGEPVRRNNPGQDFNCRCFARPIVRFKT